MNCQEFKQFASAVLDGEAGPEVFAHLAGCHRCRVLVDELAAIIHASHSLPTHDPSPQLWVRLRAVAQAEGLWERTPWWERLLLVPPRLAFAGGMAALLLLLGVGLVGYPQPRAELADLAPATALEVARGELVGEPGYAVRYQIHLIQMERDVLDESTPMDDNQFDLVEQPLNVVSRAIEQSQSYLADYPDDSLARDQLHYLYRQKAAVLYAVTNPVWQEYGD